MSRRKQVGMLIPLLLLVGALPCAGCAAPNKAGANDRQQRLEMIIERLQKERDDAIRRSAEETSARQDAEQLLKESQLRVKRLLEEAKNKDEQITFWMKKATELVNLIEAYEARTGEEMRSMREPPPREPPPIEQPRIEGVVTDVKRDGDEVWVQLSVGSSSGVKKGMRFIIYGTDGYKGDMLVMRVLPDSSIGRLVGPRPKEVAKGDRATRLRTSP